MKSNEYNDVHVEPEVKYNCSHNLQKHEVCVHREQEIEYRRDVSNKKES